jgi:polysaccharide export outer membrane protein
VDLAPFEGWAFIPVIFSVSFRDPGGYFLATNMNMRHDDVIFAANAKSVEVTKFMQYLNVILTTADNTAKLGIDIWTLRGLMRHPP